MKYVAFHPYPSVTNGYTVKMKALIRKEYELVEYYEVRAERIPLEKVGTIYLNWLENVWTEDDYVFLMKAKSAGVRIVWVFHNRIPHDTNKTEVDNKIKIIKILIELSDSIIIHCKGSMRYLEEYVPHISLKKVQYIPLFNYCNEYGHLTEDVRQKFNIKEKEFVFAIYGLIKPYKNIELLIEVFERLNLPNSKLLIIGRAGNKEYFAELKKSIHSANIIIQNKYIDNLAMGSYLDAVDIMVLPYSIASSMNSSAMILAFSYAKPVIISNITMTEDFDRSLFYVYESDRDEEKTKANLAAKMLEAYYNGREDNIKKGKHLMEIVKNDCPYEVIKEKLLEVVNVATAKNISKMEGVNDFLEEQLAGYRREVARQDYSFQLAYDWLIADRRKQRISDFLHKHNVHTVAIYGMGKVGKLLYEDLSVDRIHVKYGIDMNSSIKADIPMYTLKDELPEVEVIIVTVWDYEGVKLELTGKVEADIISIKDLFDNIDK